MPSAIADNSAGTPVATAAAPANLELRHITSNTHLPSPPKENRLSKRTSQHLRTHPLGSRSPASIPSSPTSVHSSSSAIFERDIELITPPPSHFTHSTDPHRIPRGKLTEQLDQCVPTVLDSAAEILASGTDDKDVLDSISIVAPLSLEPFGGGGSGFTSPISQFSSRSPSPSATNRRSMLMNLPSPSPSFTLPLPIATSTSSGASPHTNPAAQMAASQSQPQPHSPPSQTPLISTPTSAYFSVHSEDSSPTTATHAEHPLHTLTTPASPTTPSAHVPPSPKNTSKRLSFISYTDLLSSAPATALSLSSLTTSAQANEPPPHLPSVIGIPQAQAHGQTSSAASIHGSMSAAAWVTERDPATDLADAVGGEWEREGLGKGLEERLETLMTLNPQNVVPLGQKV